LNKLGGTGPNCSTFQIKSDNVYLSLANSHCTVKRWIHTQHCLAQNLTAAVVSFYMSVFNYMLP